MLTALAFASAGALAGAWFEAQGVHDFTSRTPDVIDYVTGAAMGAASGFAVWLLVGLPKWL